ncbi:CATRA system-associated protein [Streptomyces sp. NPDC101776]|uniref:CATRA system-associated protein n=1 Tax=Streptomyces sp. NPDC101776 TaxID=3366146 RepID=UPI0037FC8F4E
MSTTEGAAMIDRETAGEASLALRLMLEEWRQTPEVWVEIAKVLDDLSAAVAAGEAAEVAVLTGRLEVLSGHRVTRITEPERVPLPEEERGRVVALVHTLAPDSPPDGRSPAPPARAERT